MKTSHLILLYVIGGLMLVLIKEASASSCIDNVYAGYKDFPAVMGFKARAPRPSYKGQVESYCACIELIERNKVLGATTQDIMGCAAITNLFDTIRV